MTDAGLHQGRLGSDFWKFRLGQLISLLGDDCSSIALAWWVLDKTGSAAAMSSVLAPTAIVRVVLLPLFGALGDKCSRKKLIIIADLWRFIFVSAIATMVVLDYFNLPLLIGASVCSAIGTGLFNAVAPGIVPRLVERSQIQSAFQQTQAINSFGAIAGGIAGGVIVSSAGVVGAFLIDAVSYLIGAACTALIKSNTEPVRKTEEAESRGFNQWMKESFRGFQILYSIPVLFWICIIVMVINLVVAPLGVALPVLAKQDRGMPAWFLGALESSIGLGAIVGALSFSRIGRLAKPHIFFVASIVLSAVGIILLPWAPDVLMPLALLFLVGMGQSWATIPIGAQISLTVPDAYRARVGSIVAFLCTGIAPLGLAGAGYMISHLGLDSLLIVMGAVLIFLAPFMLLIPLFKEFLAASSDDGEKFLEIHYAGVFSADEEETPVATRPLGT